jgi:PadR family transcriptional regulator AphA
MSLEHAILGFLNYQPFSGYDLKKTFDTTVQHFWPADQSQIYRTLARLTEQGCIDMEKVEQTSRPDRKVYHITETGRRELARWMAAAPPMDPARSAALVQVFFIGQLSDKQILAKFEGFAMMMRGILKIYGKLPDKIEVVADQIGSPRETFFWLSTLDLGKRTARANLEWAEHVIAQIKKGEVPKK